MNLSAEGLTNDSNWRRLLIYFVSGVSTSRFGERQLWNILKPEKGTIIGSSSDWHFLCKT